MRTKIPSRRSRINRALIAETGVIPPGMQLLQDTFSFKVLDKKNTIVEDANGKEQPVMKITGLFQEGDKRNANGRIYPTREVLIPAVKAIQEDISNRAVLGELDHPSTAKVHLDRASHLITRIWMDGRKVYGEAEVLHNLPCGATLRGLFEHNVQVGISSRGVGDMEVSEDNGQEVYIVQEGYTFVTFDAVAEPSVHGATLQCESVIKKLNKKLKPVVESKSKFSPEVYQSILVREINDFFGI